MQIPNALQHLLRPIPVVLVQRAASSAYRRVMARHTGFFDRLGEHSAKTFVFAPKDLPFEFAIRPAEGRVRVAKAGCIRRHDARISGPIFLLLALAEGGLDGDAEFFGRQIAIEGDMEAVLALRNALEDCRIDFTEDLAPRRGPLRRPVSLGLKKLRSMTTEKREATWS